MRIRDAPEVPPWVEQSLTFDRYTLIADDENGEERAVDYHRVSITHSSGV